MKIDILYFEGCPHHRATVSMVEELTTRLHLEAEISQTEVLDSDDAKSKKFLGSPTIRVNGLDVEPSARSSREFGMMCRVYENGGRKMGVPPEDLIRRAFEQAIEAATHGR